MLREATVALDAIGDAATRFNCIDGYDDVGLRGGRVTYTTDDGADVIAALHAVHWTNDTTVTGTLHSDSTALAVSGTVTLTARSGASRIFTVCWDTTGLHTQARIRTGPFTLTAPAP